MRVGLISSGRKQYTTIFKKNAQEIQQKVHYTGNNVKAMHISVEASLKKLRTDYIDILYVHWASSTPRSRRRHERLIIFCLVGLGHVCGRGHEWSP